mgnify:CR=1 FL=1
MKTSGQLLFQARLQSKLTLTQLERLTKIPKHILRSLEKDQYDQLPSTTYLQGFIRNYAQALNLDSQMTVAVFKRQFSRKTAKKILPPGLIRPLNSSRFPVSFTGPVFRLVLALCLLFGYLGFNLYRLYKPPFLTVSQPENGATLTSPVLIKGKTDRNASLKLNDKIINLEPDGTFTTAYQGFPGTHELTLTSTSRRQKETVVTRHVIISP